MKRLLTAGRLPAATAPIVGMRTAAADGRDAVTREFEAEFGLPIELLPPADFYAMARDVFIIVQTGERRFYGNLLVRKGVIEPPLHP